MHQSNNEKEEKNRNQNNREEGSYRCPCLDQRNRAARRRRSTLNILQVFNLDLNDNDQIVAEGYIPARPNITNLNSLLEDICVRYIAIKKKDFDLHFKVFSEVVGKLHRNMKTVDKYYKRYANDIRFAGSHYDKLRIKKPDEFDMDIVIGLPVNIKESVTNPQESDIIIEQRFPEYVQLKARTQYLNIWKRDGTDCTINKVISTWVDDRKYILSSKFKDWFKGVGNKALKMFPQQGLAACVVVDGVTYTVRTSASGPAWTIIIKSRGFRLDVDLVPALKFPESRWPVGRNYRSVPLGCNRGYWLVVPEPNKGGKGTHDEERSWRLALHNQEKQLMHDTYQLRQTIRLIKKFRNEKRMKKITSNCIKNLFFWEIVHVGKSFWKHNNLATLFMHMLQRLKSALDKGEIKYFWNGDKNLIGAIKPYILRNYSAKVSKLIFVIDSDYKSVARHLLSNAEYNEYKHFL